MIHHRYRPTTWTEFVGQDKAVRTVRRIIERPEFDRGSFWIEASGANNSGVGKTTLAWLIARQLADEFFVTEINGGRCDRRAIQDIERSCRLYSFSTDKPFRVWIVNESHAIPQSGVDEFLQLLDPPPKHCCVIFTTTRKVDESLFGDHDSGPFASRCHCITLTNQGLAQAFAIRAKYIAETENLDGQPISAYVKLVQSCKNNMRAVLQRIEAGDMLETNR